MKIKFVTVFVLLVAAVLIAGCINGKDGENTALPGSEILSKTNPPVGFTHEATHPIVVNINGNLMNATEGVYGYKGDYLLIQIIKNDKPASLVDLYKADLQKEFKTGESIFEEITFNGHNATQFRDYTVTKEGTKPSYSVIWANDKYMFVVGSYSDAGTVVNLAAATGS